MDKVFENYIPAPSSLLDDEPEYFEDPAFEKTLEEKAGKLEETFRSFGLEAKVANTEAGPSALRFELSFAAGTKIADILALRDEIRLAMEAVYLRFIAPVSGKNLVAIEIPNEKRTLVRLKGLVEADEFKCSSPLTAALGRGFSNKPYYCDIARMPNLLIAGSMDSGKSVCMHSIITSILMHSSPEDVRMILVDTKMIEFSLYNGIPHLIMPVITDPEKALKALRWAVTEMKRRHELFVKEHVRDIKSYNEKYVNGTREHLPYILIVIDEIMEMVKKDVNGMDNCIAEITALGRASGIHLVMAAQRPTCDIISNECEAKIGSRIIFAVSNRSEFFRVIDEREAEQLSGQGDMVFAPVYAVNPVRMRGVYVDMKEADRVADHLKSAYGAMYDNEVIEQINMVC